MMPNTQLLSSHCSVPSLSPSSNWLLRDQYVIKKILLLNLKYSIVPAPAMEMNNIAAETRTVGQESSGGRWSEKLLCLERMILTEERWGGEKSCPRLWGQVSSGRCTEGGCQCGLLGSGYRCWWSAQGSPHTWWHSPLVPCSPALSRSVAVPARALSSSKSLSKFPTSAA